MTVDIVMPRLSDSMEEGTVLKWLKSEGDQVTRGEDLVEIETDKANMTYQSDTEGVLTELIAEEGDTLPVGTVIARIETKAAAPKPDTSKARTAETATPETKAAALSPEAAGTKPKATAAKSERRPMKEQPPPTPDEPRVATRPEGDVKQKRVSGNRIHASPVARRIARKLRVDLAAVTGSGPGGRIVKADIEKTTLKAASPEAQPATPSRAPTVPPETTAPPEIATAPSKAAAPHETGVAPHEALTVAQRAESVTKGAIEILDLTRLQRTVARRMAESKATAPHFYLQAEIDMTEAVHLRRQLKTVTDEPVPTYNDMIVKAAALALREHPRANGAYRDGRIELYSRVNIGVAVAADEALVVPTVTDADRRSLSEISRIISDLSEKVRNGTITPPDLSGGTFTVSNLGMYGIQNFSAVINPPQAALLSTGEIKKRAMVDQETDEIVPRSMMGVTLACDHRILYGTDGAELLGHIRRLLEEPLSLVL